MSTLPKKFTIRGVVVRKSDQTPVPHARVEIWDKDRVHDDLIHEIYTNDHGVFEEDFTATRYADHPKDQLPDIFLKVFINDTQIHQTKIVSLKKVSKTCLDFKIDLATPAVDILPIQDTKSTSSNDKSQGKTSTTLPTDSDDADVPKELLPSMKEYPTDRVFYDVVLLHKAEEDRSGRQDLGTSGPLDILGILHSNKKPIGFSKPMTGAILTYSQSWYPEGLALGQLLHSVGLAPGESTKIAVIDWARQTMTSVEEGIEQTEDVKQNMAQARSISEVTDALARECQSGFSQTASTSTTNSGGSSSSSSFLIFGSGVSNNHSTTNTAAKSISSSEGQRNVSASMAQNILNRTQQHATSSRTRRASIVREVTQQEQETISTRVITNYNHMHALTIQYFEVVQMYRVAVQLVKCQRCLFIPLALIDFSDERTIERFRHILFQQALTEHAQQLLLNSFSFVQLLPSLQQKHEVLQNQDKAQHINSLRKWALTNNQKAGLWLGDGLGQWQLPVSAELYTMTVSGMEEIFIELEGEPDPIRLDENAMAEFKSSTVLNNLRPAAGTIKRIFGKPISDPEIKFGVILLDFCFPSSDNTYQRKFAIENYFVLPNGRNRSISLLQFQQPSTQQELTLHLMENQLYYSQQIWMNIDPQLLLMMLAHYTYRGKQVIEYIDPTPVAVAGNCLGFRWHWAEDNNSDQKDESWAGWKEANVNMDLVHETYIPLPTGGVFTEAVLGRANSAEKLDLTRFWNWQDSPIPIQAPEISPISSGSRATTDELRPGNLDSPIVQISNPSPLPDPTGLASTLNALVSANMFRDMSGLAQTIGLAQQGLTTSSQAATATGQQASDNLSNQLKAQTALMESIVKTAATSAGIPPAAGELGSNPSNSGAILNYAKQWDSNQTSGAASSQLQGREGQALGGLINPVSESVSNFVDSFSKSLNASADSGNGDGTNETSTSSVPDETNYYQRLLTEIARYPHFNQQITLDQIRSMVESSPLIKALFDQWMQPA